jgi:hypothetical protein
MQPEGQSKRRSRRLITLIFAGRNRIIVIRRELPRTKGAGLVQDLPHRMVEDSPSCTPSTATHAASCDPLTFSKLFLGRLPQGFFLLRFHLYANSPDKS